MQPPERFYYNMGEFLRECNMEYGSLPEESSEDNEIYHNMGIAVGHFYQGVLSVVNDGLTAARLAGEFMWHLEMDKGDYAEDEDEGQ
jgi:hypothetical protein